MGATATFILPGTSLGNENEDTSFGPGTHQEVDGNAYCTKAGYLIEKNRRGTELVFAETNSKRYIPANRDLVIGTVIGKAGEHFRVLLQDKSVPVRLGQFAFENANKKNRPNLANGTAVYGRIVLADPDIEAEMECVDGTTGKAEGFGELKEGYIVSVGLGYARALLSGGAKVLEQIGDKITYDVAIGMNGKVWVKSTDDLATLKVAQCIQKAETISSKELEELVASL